MFCHFLLSPNDNSMATVKSEQTAKWDEKIIVLYL